MKKKNQKQNPTTPARGLTPSPWHVSSVSDGTFTIHRMATAPDPIAHDILTVENARLIAAAPDLLALLEWITRCAKMPAPHGISAYAIRDQTMNEARALVASLADPKTYLARERAKMEAFDMLTEAVRLFDDVEAGEEHPDPTDDGINCAREALRLFKS